jgi:primosomal protein N'
MRSANPKHPVSKAPAQSALGIASAVSRRVPVLLPYPFAGPFDYRVPAGLDPRPGDVVLVPLNRREEVGVVWDGEADHSVGDNRLRPIEAILDTPPMRDDIRRLVDWVASYTVTPPGDVLAMALRVNALRPDAPPTGWRLVRQPPDGATPTGAVGLGGMSARQQRQPDAGRRCVSRDHPGNGQCGPAAAGGPADAVAVWHT